MDDLKYPQQERDNQGTRWIRAHLSKEEAEFQIRILLMNFYNSENYTKKQLGIMKSKNQKIYSNIKKSQVFQAALR